MRGQSRLVFNRGQKKYPHLSERPFSTSNLQKEEDFKNFNKQKAESGKGRPFLAARFDHYVLSIDTSKAFSFLYIYSKKLGPGLEEGIR